MKELSVVLLLVILISTTYVLFGSEKASAGKELTGCILTLVEISPPEAKPEPPIPPQPLPAPPAGKTIIFQHR